MLAVDIAVLYQVLDECLEVFYELLALEFLLLKGQEVYLLHLDLWVRGWREFSLRLMDNHCFFVDLFGDGLLRNHRSS